MRIILALFNFLAFEAAWFAAVSGGAAGRGWLLSLPVVLVVAVHLFLARARLGTELRLILAVTLLGVMTEAGFMAAGLIRYAGTAEGQILPPVWIAALWFGFGTLPNASLSWLKGRWGLQALLGAVSGPLTYAAGVKLGAASLPDPGAGWALLVIGLTWALVLPVIFLMADAFSSHRRQAPAGLS